MTKLIGFVLVVCSLTPSAHARPSVARALSSLLSIGMDTDKFKVSPGALELLNLIGNGPIAVTKLPRDQMGHEYSLTKLGLIRRRVVDYGEMFVGAQYELTWTGYRYLGALARREGNMTEKIDLTAGQLDLLDRLNAEPINHDDITAADADHRDALVDQGLIHRRVFDCGEMFVTARYELTKAGRRFLKQTRN